MLELSFDNLFATYSCTSYRLVGKFLTISDHRLSYSPKFTKKVMNVSQIRIWRFITRGKKMFNQNRYSLETSQKCQILLGLKLCISSYVNLLHYKNIWFDII